MGPSFAIIFIYQTKGDTTITATTMPALVEKNNTEALKGFSESLDYASFDLCKSDDNAWTIMNILLSLSRMEPPNGLYMLYWAAFRS